MKKQKLTKEGFRNRHFSKMRTDEVNEDSSKAPQDTPRRERGSDELSENASKNKKNSKRERGGKRTSRKKQNAARFPKKSDVSKASR